MRISDWSSDVCSSDLRRVALILARLSDIQIAGNWANSPRASLQDIFRPWFPQTGATIDQRIRTLDHLMEHAPEVTFALFDHMTDTGQIGRAHVCTPVTNALIVCRLPLDNKNHPYKLHNDSSYIYIQLPDHTYKNPPLPFTPHHET